jgi:hypothetical protein
VIQFCFSAEFPAVKFAFTNPFAPRKAAQRPDHRSSSDAASIHMVVNKTEQLYMLRAPSASRNVIPAGVAMANPPW